MLSLNVRLASHKKEVGLTSFVARMVALEGVDARHGPSPEDITEPDIWHCAGFVPA